MVKPATHGDTELEDNNVFKNNQPKGRNMVDKDKRIAIAEYILDYVKRNPGKQIPCGKIGEQCDTPPYNISSIIKQLVRLGELKQISRYTYVIGVGPKPQEQLPLPPQPTPDNIANQVEALAKEYVWQSDAPSLKGFVSWLKK